MPFIEENRGLDWCLGFWGDGKAREAWGQRTLADIWGLPLPQERIILVEMNRLKIAMSSLLRKEMDQ